MLTKKYAQTPVLATAYAVTTETKTRMVGDVGFEPTTH